MSKLSEKREPLVILEKMEPFTTSDIIAKGTGHNHNAVVQLIRKYENDLKEIGTFQVQIEKTRGRNKEVYLLNEDQMIFLIMLMKNSPIIVEFKLKITKEFKKMKKHLLDIMLRQKEESWKETRALVKETTKLKNETIEDYVVYCIENGSKGYKENPERAYSNFAKMINTELFITHIKNNKIRDFLDHMDLSKIKFADKIVEETIKKEMDKNTPYKDIYQICKVKISELANFLGKSVVGKELLDDK